MDWWTLLWIVLGIALVWFMIRGCGGMMRGRGMGGCGMRSEPRHKTQQPQRRMDRVERPEEAHHNN